MSFYDKASAKWPEISWTGSSAKHVSLYANIGAPFPPNARLMILKLLDEKKAGLKVWRFLSKRFGGVEWLLSSDEFKTLFMVDVNRHLLGQPDSYSPQKLKNPVTGNEFHRVALCDDMMCGIRFWAELMGDKTYIGFRFRIESQIQDEEKVRREARERIEEAVAEMPALVAEMELMEPTMSDLNKMEECLKEMED